ncbi:MAG: amino acid adenylation domain-containing protein, partial [Polyangiaceae bacterium]
LEYSTALFDRSTIEQIVEHLRVALTEMVKDAGQRVESLSLLTDAERRALTSPVQGPTVENRGSVHARVEAQAARAPDAPAVTYQGQTLGYRALNERANQLAHRLRREGVVPETVVGIEMERSPELVIAMLAVLKSGAAYLPLDPAMPAARRAFILEDAGVGVLLTQSSRLDPSNTTTHRVIDLADTQALQKESTSNPTSVTSPDHLAYVIYTSGSTGQPKGVLITHNNLARVFDATDTWFGFRPDDVWTLFHSPSFDFSVWEIWGALTFGSRLVVVPPCVSRLSDELYELIVDERVTVLCQTPSAFRPLMRIDQVRASPLSLRYVIFGGEALEPGMLEPWFARHPSGSPAMINMYGITETTIHVTYRPITERDVELGARSVIGEPMPGLYVHVLDENAQLVPIGVPGELVVGGPGVARGYLNRPELTAQRFIPDPFTTAPSARLYRSGDRARRLANGDIEYLGRADTQVKVRGFRIELGEIEAALNSHPSVDSALVICREDRPGEKTLVAYCTPKSSASRSTDPPITTLDARSWLGERLPAHMVPSAFVVLDAFPLTSNGKLDRAALPMPSLGGTSKYEAPRNALEEQLARIWSDLLRVPRVGIDDDFFDLGGHSLLATRMAAQLRSDTGADLPLRRVFDAPTIRTLADYLNGALPSAPMHPLRRSTREGRIPLSYSQLMLWYREQQMKGTATLHLQQGYRLKGSIDIDAIERATDEMFRRHEALRTTFGVADGEPEQIIERSRTEVLEHVDLSDSPADADFARVRDFVAVEFHKPMPVLGGRLVRVLLVRVARDDHFLVLLAHRLVLDGLQLTTFFDEVFAIYDAFLEGKPSPLHEPAVQYADFAIWQHKYMESPAVQQHLAYWKERLRGARPLVLPTDRATPPTRTSAVHVEAVPMGSSVAEDVDRLAKEEGTNAFVILAAVFKTYLSKIASETDIVIVTPSEFWRSVSPELESTFGRIADLLVLRTDLSGNPTFREVIQRVHGGVLEAYAHALVPSALVLDSAIAVNPLQRVVLNYLGRALPPEPRVSGLEVELAIRVRLTRMGDFVWSLFLSGLSGLLASCDLFDQPTVARMSNELHTLLLEALAAPGTPIDDLQPKSS